MSKTEVIAYSIPGAAAAVGLSRSYIYELIRQGQLTSVRIGGRRLVRKIDLESLLSAAQEGR